MGIDFDLPARIRDADAFMDTILNSDERRILGLPPSPEAATLVWSIKEAAAKALGIGIQGRPQAFALVGCDMKAGQAQVRYGTCMIDVQMRQVSDAVCAVAYTPDLGAKPVL
jgi:phosphopantetheinyl transferase (holo-ACP synthase)